MPKWRSFEPFWGLIEDLTTINSEICLMMLKVGYHRAIGHFYFQRESPWFVEKEVPKKVPEDRCISALKPIVGALSNLLRRCSIERGSSFVFSLHPTILAYDLKPFKSVFLACSAFLPASASSLLVPLSFLVVF